MGVSKGFVLLYIESPRWRVAAFRVSGLMAMVWMTMLSEFIIIVEIAAENSV
jgi:hypothetical protein